MEGLVFKRVCKEQLFVVQYSKDITGRNIGNTVGTDASHEDDMALLYDKPDDVLIDLDQQESSYCMWCNGLKIFYCFFGRVNVLYDWVERRPFFITVLWLQTGLFLSNPWEIHSRTFPPS